MDELRRTIALREAELAELKAQLAAAEARDEEHGEARGEDENGWKWPLRRHEYERYSRQMIVPRFGLQGQMRMREAKVLLVGAGGLGCPAAAYLAGAGVGTLGLVDGDVVEASNLHRQIAHATARVGTSKVDSAIEYLNGLNPTIAYKAHRAHLDVDNADGIIAQYDLVLDCTDHPTSRYLVSDVCVRLDKPLVSASALQTSGQLMVLNDPPGEGPCYRCVFPRPPPPESVTACGEAGILGPVVGVMGVLQALEAIKVICGQPRGPPSMLLFSQGGFRSVRMRGRRKGCVACEGTLEGMDYVRFCGAQRPVTLLHPEERVSVENYHAAKEQEHILVDVREKEHFDVCHLEGAVNIPLGRFMATEHEVLGTFEDLAPDAPIYLICRVGNDSQIAARKLKDMGLDRDGQRFVGDVSGGIKAWRDAIDPSLPFI